MFTFGKEAIWKSNINLKKIFYNILDWLKEYLSLKV